MSQLHSWVHGRPSNDSTASSCRAPLSADQEPTSPLPSPMQSAAQQSPELSSALLHSLAPRAEAWAYKETLGPRPYRV